jgi:hypothetical protein
MTKAREWRNWQIKKRAPENFEEYVTSLPSPKFPTVLELRAYIRAVTAMLPDLLRHYGSPAHRKWRLKVPNQPVYDACISENTENMYVVASCASVMHSDGGKLTSLLKGLAGPLKLRIRFNKLVGFFKKFPGDAGV